MSPPIENSSKFQTSNTTIESPFPSSVEFVREEPDSSDSAGEYFIEPDSPFPSIYELENELEQEGIVAPEMEEYVAFLDELYDEEFNDAIADLIDEATDLYQEQFESEYADPIAHKGQAMYLLEAQFQPLIGELESFTEGLVHELESLDFAKLRESEINSLIDRYDPEFEGNFVKKVNKNKSRRFKRKIKRVFEHFIGKLKKGIGKVGKFIKDKGLGAALNRLKGLIRPLLERVLKSALDRLPPQYRPIAQTLAQQLFNKEVAELEAFELGDDTTQDIITIQREFDRQVANLLFAESEADMDATVASYATDAHQPVTEDAVDTLNHARAEFINQIAHLKDGDDPTPIVENFVTAILPALKLALKLIGRPKVVAHLAQLECSK
jgi:hypothetical protein